MKIFIHKNVFLDLENISDNVESSYLLFFDPPFWKIGKYAWVKKGKFSFIKTIFATSKTPG